MVRVDLAHAPPRAPPCTRSLLSGLRRGGAALAGPQGGHADPVRGAAAVLRPVGAERSGREAVAGARRSHSGLAGVARVPGPRQSGPRLRMPPERKRSPRRGPAPGVAAVQDGEAGDAADERFGGDPAAGLRPAARAWPVAARQAPDLHAFDAGDVGPLVTTTPPRSRGPWSKGTASMALPAGGL